MYKIISDFAGANIRVLSQTDEKAQLAVDLRDTESDWFYWCFKVEGAAGQTVTFCFENKNRVGYFGAAVSDDYENWRWQYADGGHQGDQFTYTFGARENAVYFAHNMLYRPERFERFAAERGLHLEVLCHSERGRTVPYFDNQKAGKAILLTARHHACEATGSYVLEGVLSEMLAHPVFASYRIICVPMVDYDGVVDGDQGKSRRPHDHNRDYDPALPPRYKSVAALRERMDTLSLQYFFDFHSPWHLGGENDTVFFVVKDYPILPQIARLSGLWEKQCGGDCLPHFAADDVPPDTKWNKAGAPTSVTYALHSGACLACSVETPYFIASGVPFSPERARQTGRAFVRALAEYLK